MSGAVGYLTKRFPRLSETFILDEILGLERCGVPLRLYAMGHPRERIVQPDAERVRSQVRYLHGTGGARAWVTAARGMVAANAGFARRHPRRYATVLAGALAERPSRPTVKRFAEAVYLAGLLERDGVRHLHAAFAHGPAEVARLVHQLSGIPYSFGGHAKDLYLTDPAVLAQRVADARFALVCSESAAEHLRKAAGDASAKVVLAPHGVDTARFRPPSGTRRFERAVAPGPGSLRLLAVGRLVEKKGYPVLLRAIDRARDAGYPITLTAIGDGAQLPDLRALAAELRLGDAIRFVGPRTHQEVAAAYLEADAFAQASVVLADGDRDGIPNSLLEAMASGLAVIATRTGGIPEVIVDGESGLLAAPGDVESLARQLMRIAADGDLRQRLGMRARATVVERFDRSGLIRTISPLFEVRELAEAS
ncbi:MAG: glycosyltransferase [Candidatus Limnocylindrales bacterium]